MNNYTLENLLANVHSINMNKDVDGNYHAEIYFKGGWRQFREETLEKLIDAAWKEITKKGE